MAIEIDEYILRATTKCKNNLSCLNGKEGCLCKINHNNGSHTIQIKGMPLTSCNYYLHIYSACYCLCPVRNELWNRYGI